MTTKDPRRAYIVSTEPSIYLAGFESSQSSVGLHVREQDCIAWKLWSGNRDSSLRSEFPTSSCVSVQRFARESLALRRAALDVPGTRFSRAGSRNIKHSTESRFIPHLQSWTGLSSRQDALCDTITPSNSNSDESFIPATGDSNSTDREQVRWLRARELLSAPWPLPGAELRPWRRSLPCRDASRSSSRAALNRAR